ncbi:MAG: hypothetical protein RSN88_10830 [Gordonibacter sp.]|uniref:hypothetical protein n=1 Tax=Gordonibacter sp. TaxID=1968902 RepID=UPI002FC92BE7
MIKSVINDLMESLDLPYQYWEYEDLGEGIPSSYFVGERMPDSVGDESGGEGGMFVLSGWSRGGLVPLVSAESAIKAVLDAPGGDVRFAGEGGACVVWYLQSQDIPSDVEGMCRMEVTLGYREWS